jgi:CRP/FNR family transcriptional regulator, cyclic AMP receptor protein
MALDAQRIELLQQMPIFGAVSDEALAFLLERTRCVRVKAGECFFHENESANSMFVLEEGEIQILKNWDHHPHVLCHMKTGDCFGEMALLDLSPRSATAQAQQDCLAIELTAEALYALVEHDSAAFAVIQMNIGRELCRRLRAADDLMFRSLMDQTLPPTPFRESFHAA